MTSVRVYRAPTPQDQRGIVLVSIILVTAVILAVAISILGRATQQTKLARTSVEFEQSWYAALAGVEECLAIVQHQKGSWTLIAAPSGEVWCHTHGGIGDATYWGTGTTLGGGKLRIEMSGRAGHHTRTLHAVVQIKERPGSDVDFMAGGSIWFGGAGSSGWLRGNMGAVGTLQINSHMPVCGTLSQKSGLPTAPNITTYPGCEPPQLMEDPSLEFPAMDLDAKWNDALTRIAAGQGELGGVMPESYVFPGACTNPVPTDPQCVSTSGRWWYITNDLLHGSTGGNLGGTPEGNVRVECDNPGLGGTGPGSKVYLRGNHYFIVNGEVCFGRAVEVIDGYLHIYSKGGFYLADSSQTNLKNVLLYAYDVNNPNGRGKILTPGDEEVHGRIYGSKWYNTGETRLNAYTADVPADGDFMEPQLISLWED